MFMYMIGRGVPREDVAQIFENVAFITFNYDRCLEHFLREALAGLYSLNEGDAGKIVDDARIIHPYGDVGALSEVPFGASTANYDAFARNTKTCTEQIAAADVMHELANEVARAGCVVFLGFAYHNQNMKLIKPKHPVPAKPMYGTAFGMSDSDVSLVSSQLVNFLKSDVSVQEAKYDPNREQADVLRSV
jgi:hypothetical protein